MFTYPRMQPTKMYSYMHSRRCRFLLNFYPAYTSVIRLIALVCRFSMRTADAVLSILHARTAAVSVPSNWLSRALYILVFDKINEYIAWAEMKFHKFEVISAPKEQSAVICTCRENSNIIKVENFKKEYFKGVFMWVVMLKQSFSHFLIEDEAFFCPTPKFDVSSNRWGKKSVLVPMENASNFCSMSIRYPYCFLSFNVVEAHIGVLSGWILRGEIEALLMLTIILTFISESDRLAKSCQLSILKTILEKHHSIALSQRK